MRKNGSQYIFSSRENKGKLLYPKFLRFINKIRQGRIFYVRQPLRTAKFGEIGRHAVGGLRNGDLLIASKVRSIRFTDDK